MNIKVTLWAPDTCDCIILKEFDNDLPQDQRIETPIASVTTSDGKIINVKCCNLHKSLEGDLVAHFNAILSENSTRQIALQAIHEAFPDIYQLPDTALFNSKTGAPTHGVIVNDDGTIKAIPIKETQRTGVPHFFDESRNLVADISALDEVSQDALSQKINNLTLPGATAIILKTK